MIRYVVIPHGKTKLSVIVILNCPKCGRIGILRRYKPGFNGRRYRIFHQNGCCTFSPTSENYDEVDEIYRRVKG